LAVGPELIVLGVSGLDSVYVYARADHSRVAHVWLPAVHRRPAPRSLEALREEFGRPRDPAELWQAASFLLGIHVLSSGEIAILHLDQSLTGQAISSTAFLTLIS